MPDAQSWHVVEPTSSANVCALQSAHAPLVVAPTVGLYFPVAHSLHVVAAAASP